MKNFKDVLEEIKQKEFSLRNPITEQFGLGTTTYGPNWQNWNKYDLVVSFLIFAKYSNAFDFSDIHESIDINRYLKKSSHYNAVKLLSLWEEINNTIDYPYLLECIEILNQYDLAKYYSEDNDVIIADFVNKNILFDHTWIIEYKDIPTQVFELIDSCAFQLGIESNQYENIFISVESGTIIRRLLEKYKNRRLVFSRCSKFSLYTRVAIGFLECYKDCQYIKEEGNKFFPFDNVQFDGIYYMEQKQQGKPLDELIKYVREDGFCVAFNQPKNDVSETFLNIKIPLVLDIEVCLAIVAINSKDEKERVRYGYFDTCNDQSCLFYKNHLEPLIKNGGYSTYFQILSKDDFRYASSKDIRFFSIRRKEDQRTFVWRDLKDIISTPDDEDIIQNPDAEIGKVVTDRDLSSNPFHVKADDSIYSTFFENTAQNENQMVEEFEIKRHSEYSDLYNFSIPQKYEDIFYKTFQDYSEDDESNRFKKMLCYRLVTKPSILRSGRKVLRVDASKDRPVCIEKYSFDLEDNGYCFICKESVNVINIFSEYDENFIIHQLITNEDRDGHILVPPTKEEQHTYFVNKRSEYISKNQPALDEMDNETKQAVKNSDPRIAGIGFKNFRRFSNLDILPLSRINILVGGNNSGKSTFVKGLLLAIDNIKSLTPHNIRSVGDGSELYFQFDANNVHDIHIGTFNRAYSAKPLNEKSNSDSENPYREISFEVRISDYTIEIVIGTKEKSAEMTSVPISKLCIKDEKRNANFIFDYINKTTTMSCGIDSENETHTFPLHFSNIDYKNNVIASLIKGIHDYISSNNKNEKLQSLKEKTGFLIDISNELDYILSNAQVEYIYAHGIKQKILFSHNDKNDFMAITLHELKNENISEDEKEFIRRWMKEFGFGDDYEISSIAGEAYTIDIKKEDGKWFPLADMGMGTSQVLILIFRLATMIHRQKMKGDTPYKPTIIIEEPEQNMHPAYQSMLADLFYEVYNKYKFNFVVETHSEYIVRKTQVIVAEDELSIKENNPFMVYFFEPNASDRPRRMDYAVSGAFKDKFGKGFFDEASKWDMTIIRKEFELKKKAKQ